MANLRVKIIGNLLQLMTLVVFPIAVSAQSQSEMKNIFEKAESYFVFEEYELANQLYLLLDNTGNANLDYKIGTSYLNIPGEKEKSISYLENAVKQTSYDSKTASFKEKRAPLDSYFSLSKAYLINDQIDKALSTLQTFDKLVKETASRGGMKNADFIDQQIQACKNAMLFRENPKNFSKRNMGSDFSQGAINDNPAVSFDENSLVYTERRGVANAIFYSRKEKGKWLPPVEITADLKAGEDCSSCSLNSDGTELFIYKNDDFDGAIYSSVLVNGTWAPIKKLNKNINTKYYESHAAISADGKRLYFTSNREGGFGNLDIYVSDKDATGDWGPARNLGPVINTPFNEDTPFITLDDSTLFFSSEGHNSMGGFDIFKSRRSSDTWKTPENLGYPLNTTDDDKFLQPADNGSTAYYSMINNYKEKQIFYIGFGIDVAADTVIAGSPEKVYAKIDLSSIPLVNAADPGTLIRNLNVSDVGDSHIKDSDILYFTVQVMALHNPVDTKWFKYIDQIKVLYNDNDQFYRYTVGNFKTREEAAAQRNELINKGYPEEIFIKKVSK